MPQINFKSHQKYNIGFMNGLCLGVQLQSRTCQICLTKIFIQFFYLPLQRGRQSDSHERNKSNSGEKPEPAFSVCPMRWLLYRPYNDCRVPSFV